MRKISSDHSSWDARPPKESSQLPMAISFDASPPAGSRGSRSGLSRFWFNGPKDRRLGIAKIRDKLPDPAEGERLNRPDGSVKRDDAAHRTPQVRNAMTTFLEITLRVPILTRYQSYPGFRACEISLARYLRKSAATRQSHEIKINPSRRPVLLRLLFQRYLM